MRILVVEDDSKIARFICQGLEADGYSVDVEHSGGRAAERALSERYDLLVLDIMLPDLDGFEVLRRIRTVDASLPVIAVTARGEVVDRVKGLDLGADDYLVKPFSFVELQARIRALFRRKEEIGTRSLQVGDLTLDKLERTIRFGSFKVELSSREYQLLEFFMSHADQPLTRAMIADRVWGYQFDTGTNVIDVYVNYLRRKLRDLSLEPIQTLRGIGYRFDTSRTTAS